MLPTRLITNLLRFLERLFRNSDARDYLWFLTGIFLLVIGDLFPDLLKESTFDFLFGVGVMVLAWIFLDMSFRRSK